jgi:hypothetical protein
MRIHIRMYCTRVTASIVHISVAIDFKGCENINGSLQHKIYSLTLTYLPSN